MFKCALAQTFYSVHCHKPFIISFYTVGNKDVCNWIFEPNKWHYHFLNNGKWDSQDSTGNWRKRKEKLNGKQHSIDAIMKLKIQERFDLLIFWLISIWNLDWLVSSQWIQNFEKKKRTISIEFIPSAQFQFH